MKVFGSPNLIRLSFFIKFIIFVAFMIFAYNLYFTSINYNIFRKYGDSIKIQEEMGQNKKDRKIYNILTEKEKALLIGLDDGITDDARKIMKELNIKNAGRNGRPVIIPENVRSEIKRLNQSLWETYGYNALASSMVSLNRVLPDKRSDYCKNKEYPKDLPKASVVIPFHDDDWMLLMRAVHSVLLRTPDHLLEEILLVYDLSNREYYQERLDNYIKKYPKVRLIRSASRQGIISTRILGGKNAKGPIIVYVDSHVEVTPGWIEPMLARIKEYPNVIAWARIIAISPKDMRVWLNDSPGGLGTFKWDMAFDWMNIKWYEGNKPTPTYEPKPSVTFIGPCYAIRKDFYHKIGYLDQEFDIWGGEDVELAFRTWMCGGRVELIPCSVAAHMFKSHTYKIETEGKGGVRFNTDRIAEVWLDEYKRYYYRLVGDTKDRFFGNISARLELKKKLNCKPFKWFIDNVHPKMPIPEHIRDPD